MFCVHLLARSMSDHQHSKEAVSNERCKSTQYSVDLALHAKSSSTQVSQTEKYEIGTCCLEALEGLTLCNCVHGRQAGVCMSTYWQH